MGTTKAMRRWGFKLSVYAMLTWLLLAALACDDGGQFLAMTAAGLAGSCLFGLSLLLACMCLSCGDRR